MSKYTTPCRDERRVFRVGSERLFLPNEYRRATLAINNMREADSDWATLQIYGREVVRNGERDPFPLSQSDITNQGGYTTQIRAVISIDGEETIVGIGAGVRLSLPATTQLSVQLAIPECPVNFYPFGANFPQGGGVIINPKPASAYPSSPFPMPDPGDGTEPLPVYDSYIEASYKACRAPVGDRLARYSHQAFIDADGGRVGAPVVVVPIPSRARDVYIYGWLRNDPELGQLAVMPDVFWLRTDTVFTNPPDTGLIGAAFQNANLSYFHLRVPTNATHIALTTGGRTVPSTMQFNLNWGLEL